MALSVRPDKKELRKRDKKRRAQCAKLDKLLAGKLEINLLKPVARLAWPILERKGWV